MNEHLRRFKRIVAQVSDQSGVNFRHHGLQDLILDVGKDPSPAQIAASAAIYFCREVNQYNGSEPGLLVVMDFICETSTSFPPECTEDASRDLIALLNRGAGFDDVLQWVLQWYKA